MNNHIERRNNESSSVLVPNSDDHCSKYSTSNTVDAPSSMRGEIHVLVAEASGLRQRA